MDFLGACPCKHCTEDWEINSQSQSCHEVCYWYQPWAKKMRSGISSRESEDYSPAPSTIIPSVSR
jgi:hypothetical protein